MTDTKTLLARFEAAVVQGNTLPAFVRRYDEDWDWLNAEEMLFQLRQGIVQDCRYLLTLNTAEERAVVSKCFESREDANAIARESKQWGVPQAATINIYNLEKDGTYLYSDVLAIHLPASARPLLPKLLAFV